MASLTGMRLKGVKGEAADAAEEEVEAAELTDRFVKTLLGVVAPTCKLPAGVSAGLAANDAALVPAACHR